ncbi:MAG: hypothetical protein QM765_12040 [Myxococcales bacterium]
MRKFLIGIFGVWAIAFVAWLAIFRTLDPCEAMRQQVESVAKQAGDADGKAIREALLGPHAPAASGFYCFQVAVSLKVRGRDAVLVLRK